MTRTKTLLLLLVPMLLLLTGLHSDAQVLINKAALQKASQERALQEADMHRMVMSMARQKGWPLTLQGKKGRMSYLLGISTKGAPVYVTTTDNIISAATIGTNKLWPGGGTGLNLNGSSANMKGKIAIWDEGLVRPTHVELVGRVTQVDGATTLSDHSTHVSGTMIATGVNPVARGMANGEQLLKCYDFTNDVSEMMTAAQGGLLLSNHSYAIIAGWNYDTGNGHWEFYADPGDTVDISFGLYDATTQTWDSIAYNAPQYLIVKAAGNNHGETGPAVGQPYYHFDANYNMVAAGNRPAGLSSNDGYNVIATYGCAKNVLTIGAVNAIPGGYSSPSDVIMSDFSSWGPTGDGRIKPDVVADGVNVLSSISTADNAYDIYSGTSMASPATTGSSLLLQELYSKRNSGNFMRAATLKGILIHTADEAGPSPGPDYQFGWGLLDIPKAAAMITSSGTGFHADSTSLILENNLVNSSHESDSITVVASGKAPLIATISWTDPAAKPATIVGANFADITPKLINDLDLRISDTVVGTVYLPWVLDRKNPGAAATKGDNVLDNVERVEVNNPVPGKSYKIKVTHKSAFARGSQAYSLLVSGAGGQAYCTSSSSGANGTKINNLTFGGINNTNSSGCKTYSDFTGVTPAQLPIGQTLPISIAYQNCASGSSTTNIAVYIDYNNNGKFTDPGELVFQNSALLTSGTTAATLTGSITIPATAVAGTSSRMRIVAQDGGSSATPASCGTYTAGETQDYMVQFTNPANDVGVTGLAYPTATTCASDSQIVAVQIRNFGSTYQKSVPVTTVVKNGNTVVATLTAICKDTIPAGTQVIFTYNTSFPSVAGQTYTFSSSTALAGDLNPSNDANVSTISVNTGSSALTGTATICTSTSNTAVLKANATGNDLPLWYASATATTPIAAGANTTTTTIPSNNTFYLGVNDLNTRMGPANKLAINNGTGAYFRFGGNLIQFTTSVPLTIESAKMYIGYSGQINLTLVTLASISYLNGYSYYPVYSTSIDVHATKTTPDSTSVINIAAGDNSDTGAVYYLNIPIPVPGNYALIIDCQNYANAFLNVSSSNITYPSIPGVIAINSMYIGDGTLKDSTSFAAKTYFPFYNMGIRLAGCPGPRTAVTATTATTPVITQNGNVFTSNFPNGNQWYRSGTLIPGATNQTDTAIYSGTYQTIVNDPVTGCTLASNTINFTSTATTDVNGNTIGLKVTPNPNPGVFQLTFNVTTQDNLSIALFNTLGQRVYLSNYSNFVGQFSQTIEAGNLAEGMYVLQIVHGNNTYTKKIIVKK